MADALEELSAMIERVRVEADAAGYARALNDVARAMEPLRAFGSPAVTASGAGAALAELAAGTRAPRGQNRQWVREMLAKSHKPRAAQEIRREIERQKKVKLAYSSVQQALIQLEAAGEARKNDDGKWLLTEAPSSADDMFYSEEGDDPDRL